MAQEDYFIALAQMLMQGQARAAEGQLALSKMVEDRSRYEGEAPLREAQLAQMKAQTGAVKAGTEATKFGTQQARATAPFDLARAQEGANLLRQQVVAAENANDPEMVKLQLRNSAAEALFNEYRANLAGTQAEEAADPEMKAARKRGTLLSLASQETELRSKEAGLDEFFTGQKSRMDILSADARKAAAGASQAEYEVRSQFSPEQLEQMKTLDLKSKEVKAALESASLDAQKTANFGASIVNLKRALEIQGELPAYLQNAVETFASKRALLIGNDASPEAVAEYGRSVSQFVAALHSVGKSDPAFAEHANKTLGLAYKKLAEQFASESEASIDKRLDAVIAITDKVTDGLAVASLPQPTAGDSLSKILGTSQTAPSIVGRGRAYQNKPIEEATAARSQYESLAKSAASSILADDELAGEAASAFFRENKREAKNDEELLDFAAKRAAKAAFGQERISELRDVRSGKWEQFFRAGLSK